MKKPRYIWLIRQAKGSYAKSAAGTGFPYLSFRTKTDAQRHLDTWPSAGAKPEKVVVRIAASL